MDKNKKFDFSIIKEIGNESRKHSGEQTEKLDTMNYNEYDGYKNILVNKAMQGDKYKVNFSLSKEITQKIQYIQVLEGKSMRDYSKIAETAISLLYDIKFILRNKGINTITDMDIKSIINLIKENQEV